MFSRFKYTEYPKSVRKSLIERDKQKAKSERGGRSKRKKTIITVLAVLLAVILAFGGIFAWFWINSKKNIHPNGEINFEPGDVGIDDDTAPVIHDSGKIIEYKGATYRFNENAVSVALMGIDKEVLGTEYGQVGTGGQADTIALAVYDPQSGKVSIAVIPRDTMVDVNTYDVKGGFLDIKRQQICVSYAYGDGRETSCENTIRSINRLLMGIPVDLYLAMDLDGIPALNDAIGGVTLTCIETEGRFTEGETVTLSGEDADAYVRDRDMNRLDADTARRARQKQYMEAYLSQAMSKIKKNFSLISKLYNEAMNYVVTDISLDRVTYIATTALTNNIAVADFRTLPGSYTEGENYAEYIPDETALFEMILDMYYVKE